MTKIKKELLAPCGLYCGVCSIYIAHKDNNQKFKQVLLKVYGPFAKKVEDIQCTGCLSDGIIFKFCETCPIKSCAKEKEIEGCHQCDEFPCEMIERFPVPVGKKVIFKDIPLWRKLGTEKWVEEVEKRYHCPECGNPLFRGAKRCNKCKATVDVD
jgi:hypothetical protein